MRLRNKMLLRIALSLGVLLPLYFLFSSTVFLALALLVSVANLIALSISYFSLLQRITKQTKNVRHFSDEKDVPFPFKEETQSAPHENHRPTTVESSITKFAHYDVHTALPNRIFFNQILHKIINHAKRHTKKLAILLVTLNGLEESKAQYEEKLIEQAIQEIGNRLAKTLRNEDVIARFNNDEFIVLLNDIGQAKFVSSVAEKIIKASAVPITIAKKKVLPHCNVGICVYPHDGDSLDGLLEKVTEANYKAKLAGTNTYRYYAPTLNAEAHEFAFLKQALKQAVQKNELSMYYQPKIHLKYGTVCGVEGLLRWFHPLLTVLYPLEFLPIAEETGLMMEIGGWAMLEACKQNKHWQEEGYEHITVSINLSHKQFYHPEIINTVLHVLTQSQLSPHYLELEINEATLLADITQAKSCMNALKTIGVRLVLDHFGMGQTAIGHLKELPINAIKIDPRFIKGIPLNPNDTAIAYALIDLAHQLGFEVIAQGVETAEQTEFLLAHHCDMAQGYFLCHPLPPQKIVGQFKKLNEIVSI